MVAVVAADSAEDALARLSASGQTAWVMGEISEYSPQDAAVASAGEDFVQGAKGVDGGGVLLWFGDVSDFDDVVARVAELGAPVVRAPHRNPPEGFGPGHREIWVSDPDGYTVVVASPDGEAIEPNPGGAPS